MLSDCDFTFSSESISDQDDVVNLYSKLQNKFQMYCKSKIKYLQARQQFKNYIPIKFHSDEEYILSAVKKDASIFTKLPIHFKSNRRIVLEAVKKDGCYLELTDVKFHHDKEIVLEAVKRNVYGNAITFASDELQNDRDVVLETVKAKGYLLESLGSEFKCDREIVMAAVKQNGTALHCAQFKNDREIVLTAVDGG